MTTTHRLTAALAAALALALTAPAFAQNGGFTFDGYDCVESVAALTVPAANVEPHVPSPFKVSQTNGEASLGVAVLQCATATVDGARLGPLLVSDVGVSIERPAECAGPCGGSHFYQLWQVTDSRVLRSRMTGLGVAGALEPDITMTAGLLPGYMQSTASVGWAAAPYSISTLTAPPAPADKISGTPNWWHEAPHGATRIRYSFPGTTALGVGHGEVDTERGKLAELLGEGHLRKGAGLLIDASRIHGEAGRE